MRLINATTMKLEGPFTDHEAPAYAILSHTWGDEEISLQEFTHCGRHDEQKGLKKIREACAQALRDGLLYVWIDTVCIDKTSSAELSEAINSMYNWYAGAYVCYVYLEDFQSHSGDDLQGCRWFTRGWTLQELLAPRSMTFFNSTWESIGTKRDLVDQIGTVTKISVGCISGECGIRSYSIADRMSWASRRSTTRPEDIAYCLLGIFDVNMPLLYGEGQQRAFYRLQQEILRTSSDQTIFVWSNRRIACDGGSVTRTRVE
ncbi:heterokaryon incompatibility protein-domain-containing protein [Cercophora newfieldiana]|uniref:Heterokaryon incompatibility protein-domain-containing protein n=1 Tax=Cercophora newfieldiana TaxID=92897 RepID=A0AA39XSZ7_9PEZI|nr:heterokaryon incompatibility protein-domain-containing protein [Cercophora newfieldiana]